MLSDNPQAKKPIEKAVTILIRIGTKKYFQSPNFPIKEKAPPYAFIPIIKFLNMVNLKYTLIDYRNVVFLQYWPFFEHFLSYFGKTGQS